MAVSNSNSFFKTNNMQSIKKKTFKNGVFIHVYCLEILIEAFSLFYYLQQTGSFQFPMLTAPPPLPNKKKNTNRKTIKHFHTGMRKRYYLFLHTYADIIVAYFEHCIHKHNNSLRHMTCIIIYNSVVYYIYTYY